MITNGSLSNFILSGKASISAVQTYSLSDPTSLNAPPLPRYDSPCWTSTVNNSEGWFSKTVLIPAWPTASKMHSLKSCNITRQVFSITLGCQSHMKHWSQTIITASTPRRPTNPWRKKTAQGKSQLKNPVTYHMKFQDMDYANLMWHSPHLEKPIFSTPAV